MKSVDSVPNLRNNVILREAITVFAQDIPFTKTPISDIWPYICLKTRGRTSHLKARTPIVKPNHLKKIASSPFPPSMQFGKAIGTACSSFAITNIDDMFVLATFFAEASTSRRMTPLKITIGQYVGFTVIIIVSMIGYGVSLVLPSDPIGFLGFLPIMLGIWNLLNLVLPAGEEDGEPNFAGVRSILKVASVTVMNGGDNVGTYIPLFSQAKGAEIAVYVVTYYILLGAWCLIAFLIMKQKHILRLAQKYADILVPLLYIGLGIYIVVTSNCYPWSIERIDGSASLLSGQALMAIVTVIVLLICIIAMVWVKWRKRRAQPPPPPPDNEDTESNPPNPDSSRPSSPSPEEKQTKQEG